MSRRSCDLEELLVFEKNSLDIFHRLYHESCLMERYGEEAGELLRDRISCKSIEKAENISLMLQKISRQGIDDISESIRETREDLERWQELMGQSSHT